MSKGLIRIRNEIDHIYGDLLKTSESDILSVEELLKTIKVRLQRDIEEFQTELVNATLERLVHEVGRRKGKRTENSVIRDLFNGYKRIPQSLLIAKGERKPIERLSISELETYLVGHSTKAVSQRHEELRRLIMDCRKFVRSKDDTLEVLLRRRAAEISSD